MNRLKAVWCVRGTGRISLAHGALGSDDRAVELAPHLARSQGSRHSVLALMVNGPLSLFVSPELFNENCSVVSCRPVRRSVVFLFSPSFFFFFSFFLSLWLNAFTHLHVYALLDVSS